MRSDLDTHERVELIRQKSAKWKSRALSLVAKLPQTLPATRERRKKDLVALTAVLAGAVLASTLSVSGPSPAEVSDSGGSTATAAPVALLSQPPPSRATDAVMAGAVSPQTDTAPPDTSVFSKEQIKYLDELAGNGVPIPDRGVALTNANLVCELVKPQGFRATVEALSRSNPEASTENLVFVAASALFHLCPYQSPFGPVGETPEPPIKYVDQHLFWRVSSTGMNLGNFPDAYYIAYEVCKMTREKAPLVDAVGYVKSVSTEPSDEQNAVFAVTAISVMCPGGS